MMRYMLGKDPVVRNERGFSYVWALSWWFRKTRGSPGGTDKLSDNLPALPPHSPIQKKVFIMYIVVDLCMSNQILYPDLFQRDLSKCQNIYLGHRGTRQLFQKGNNRRPKVFIFS